MQTWLAWLALPFEIVVIPEVDGIGEAHLRSFEKTSPSSMHKRMPCIIVLRSWLLSVQCRVERLQNLATARHAGGGVVQNAHPGWMHQLVVLCYVVPSCPHPGLKGMQKQDSKDPSTLFMWRHPHKHTVGETQVRCYRTIDP
jgi:hypothetical protein